MVGLSPKLDLDQEENDSLADGVATVLEKGSPLMTAARTKSMQASNRRGLVNSSIAAQAGERAALDVALPIAQQDAAAKTGRNQQKLSTAGQSRLQSESFAGQEKLADQTQAHRLELGEQEFTNRESLLNTELGNRSDMQQLDLASKERIANMNVQANDREKAISAAAAFENSYIEGFRTVAQNENLPAEARERYLAHFAAVRDSNLALVEQLYNVDLEWASPAI